MGTHCTHSPAPQSEKKNSQRTPEQLVALLRRDCGSCHGLQLNGGLGSPLNALKGRDWKSVQSIILNGRQGTPMPPWKSVLTDNEAEWLAKYLTESKFENLYSTEEAQSL